MTYSAEIRDDSLYVTINGDCNGLSEKKLGVFALDTLTAGSTSPTDLDPHPFEPVTREVVPGTTLQEVSMILGKIGLEELRP